MLWHEYLYQGKRQNKLHSFKQKGNFMHLWIDNAKLNWEPYTRWQQHFSQNIMVISWYMQAFW